MVILILEEGGQEVKLLSNLCPVLFRPQPSNSEVRQSLGKRRIDSPNDCTVFRAQLSVLSPRA